MGGDGTSPRHPDQKLQKAWDYAIHMLGLDSSLPVKRQWVDPLRLSHSSDEYIILVECPNEATQLFAESRFTTLLTRLLASNYNHPIEVQFIVKST